ncbi:uncharacterized protein METZ01_LOCUS387591 [marine metagenome]|uniref:Uncharacterized protein n=1 Tax=marine metagenome TaxID=408172 RepID=A0A382UKY1_9ZZZZ
MNISKGLYKALESTYLAEVEDAKVRLAIYFEKSVAIGEHPQHTEEMDKLLTQISTSEDNLESLKKYFNEYNN